MASPADTASDTANDAREQIRQLRDQVDALMRDRVTPALSDAAGRAEELARQAQHVAQERVEQVSNQVREMPLTSVLIAAAAGYLIGRLTR